MYGKKEFEDWKVALDSFEKGSFLSKFDLKSGYFHIDLAPELHTYFGFQFNEIFYTYTVLPFGLSSAAHIFTKCLRTIVKYWQENLIRIVVFLDDGLGMNKDCQKTLKDSDFVKSPLLKAGIVINEEKSIWEPQAALEWTGIWWYGSEYSICIPDKRIFDLKAEIDFVCKKLPFLNARIVAK